MQVIQNLFGSNPVLFWVLLAWVTAWKGVALWKASHKGSKPWFIVMLVLNTVGVLEILYIFVFSEWKRGESKVKP